MRARKTIVPTAPKASAASPVRNLRAFTLVELLAIIAVIGVLIALRLPALARAERGTKITQCASNLRQFNLAMQIYAGENNEKLPRVTGSSSWPWDVSGAVSSQLVNHVGGWRTFYCPGTSPKFSDTDNFNLYNFDTNLRILGYSMAFSGVTTVDPTNQNQTLTPPALQVNPGVYVRQLPSERVLLADATISQGNNYTSIIGGYMVGGVVKPHLSPHLIGQVPLGGNVGMLDGHVEWRRFQDMRGRTIITSGANFWW